MRKKNFKIDASSLFGKFRDVLKKGLTEEEKLIYVKICHEELGIKIDDYSKIMPFAFEFFSRLAVDYGLQWEKLKFMPISNEVKHSICMENLKSHFEPCIIN